MNQYCSEHPYSKINLQSVIRNTLLKIQSQQTIASKTTINTGVFPTTYRGSTNGIINDDDTIISPTPVTSNTDNSSSPFVPNIHPPSKDSFHLYYFNCRNSMTSEFNGRRSSSPTINTSEQRQPSPFFPIHENMFIPLSDTRLTLQYSSASSTIGNAFFFPTNFD